jgi:uncharacterized protein
VEEYEIVNKANWNERVPAHVASVDYQVERFVTDPRHLSDVVTFDVPRLGDIAGLRGLHLQCHIGTDTISLARLGASMTGVDFSRPAVEVATELARRTGDNAVFVESDVYAAAEAVGRQAFDFVFTGTGALCWLPRIGQWAGVVASVLKPGGHLFIREGHPMLWALQDGRDDKLLVVEYPYFETKDPIVIDESGTYVETDVVFTNTVTHEWNHGLGEMVTALLDAGMTITGLTEHDSVHWNALPGLMEQVGGGEWRLADRPQRLPHSFTLQAVKQGLCSWWEADAMTVRELSERSFTEEWAKWHQQHEALLAEKHGFLAITSLNWLTEESQRFPDVPGSWRTGPEGVTVVVDPGEELVVDGDPIVGEYTFPPIPERGGINAASGDAVIEVAKRCGYDIVRPRHPDNPLRLAFAGTPAYEPNQRWVIPGRYVAFDEPRPTTVGSVVDDLLHVYAAPGEMRFEIDGRPFGLTAFDGKLPGTLNVLFNDATSGVTTYAANRGLHIAAPDADGTLTLDFNRAVNLPCAFTDFATCPLPPAENRLPIAIEAGEKVPYERLPSYRSRIG